MTSPKLSPPSCTIRGPLMLCSFTCTACLTLASKCRYPRASFRYRASSEARLGAETWTRISVVGGIASRHLVKASVISSEQYSISKDFVMNSE